MRNQKTYTIEDFNPCTDCKDYGKNCTGIDGGECEKCNAFLSIKFQTEQQKRELEEIKMFIRHKKLEYELFSFVLSNI